MAWWPAWRLTDIVTNDGENDKPIRRKWRDGWLMIIGIDGVEAVMTIKANDWMTCEYNVYLLKPTVNDPYDIIMTMKANWRRSKPITTKTVVTVAGVMWRRY